MQEAFDKILGILSVVRDKKTGMIRVSITHQSPVLAQRWVGWLVEDINIARKNQVIDEAQRSILYIEAQVEASSIIELKSMFFGMIEEQTKKILLATVRPEFLFKTIDPAIISETKAGPKRALICVVGTILGGVGGCLFALFRRFGFGSKIIK